MFARNSYLILSLKALSRTHARQHLLSHSPLRCAVQRKMVQYQTTHRHRQRSQAKELCSNKVPHRGQCQILGGHIPCRGHHRPPQHPRRIVRHRQAARSSRQVADCRLSARRLVLGSTLAGHSELHPPTPRSLSRMAQLSHRPTILTTRIQKQEKRRRLFLSTR